MNKVVNLVIEGLRRHRWDYDDSIPFSVEELPVLDVLEKEVHDDIVKVFSTKYKNIYDKYGLSDVVVDLENGYDKSRNIENVVTLFYIYFNFSKLDEKDKSGVSEVLNVLSKYNKKSDIDVYMDKGKCVFIIGAEADRDTSNRSYKNFGKLIDFIDAIEDDFKTISKGYEMLDSDKVVDMYKGEF